MPNKEQIEIKHDAPIIIPSFYDTKSY